MVDRISGITSTTLASAVGEVREREAALSRGLRIVCLNCHISNWIGSAAQLYSSTCARCGEPLIVKQVADLTPKRLKQHVGGNDLPVAILYWSPDRYESYRTADEFAVAAAHLHDKIRFARLNVDEYPAVAAHMEASHPPVLAIYRDAQEVARCTSELTVPMLIDWLRQHALAVAKQSAL